MNGTSGGMDDARNEVGRRVEEGQARGGGEGIVTVPISGSE